MVSDRGLGNPAGRSLPGQGQISSLEYFGGVPAWYQAATGQRRIAQPGGQTENQLRPELALQQRNIRSETTTPIPTASGEIGAMGIGELIRRRSAIPGAGGDEILVSQGQQGDPAANVLEPAQTIGDISAAAAPPPAVAAASPFAGAAAEAGQFPSSAANQQAQLAGMQQAKDAFIAGHPATLRAETAGAVPQQFNPGSFQAPVTPPGGFAPPPAQPTPAFIPPSPQPLAPPPPTTGFAAGSPGFISAAPSTQFSASQMQSQLEALEALLQAQFTPSQLPIGYLGGLNYG